MWRYIFLILLVACTPAGVTETSHEVLYNKSESWGPCPLEHICEQDTVLYATGELVATGEVAKTLTLTPDKLQEYTEAIEASGVMHKECEFSEIADYWAYTTIHHEGNTKNFRFPECQYDFSVINDFFEEQLE